jgi:hypothetical protein
MIMARKCTLPDLLEIMQHAKIEETNRPCPEHGFHIVRRGKLRDDLRSAGPLPISDAKSRPDMNLPIN